MEETAAISNNQINKAFHPKKHDIQTSLCGRYRLNVAVLFNKQAFVALQIVPEFESHCLGKCETKTFSKHSMFILV